MKSQTISTPAEDSTSQSFVPDQVNAFTIPLRESKPVGLEYCSLNARRAVPAREAQHLQAPRAVPAHPALLPLPFFLRHREMSKNSSLDITSAKQTLMTYFVFFFSPISPWEEVDNELHIWHWHYNLPFIKNNKLLFHFFSAHLFGQVE